MPMILDKLTLCREMATRDRSMISSRELDARFTVAAQAGCRDQKKLISPGQRLALIRGGSSQQEAGSTGKPSFEPCVKTHDQSI